MNEPIGKTLAAPDGQRSAFVKHEAGKPVQIELPANAAAIFGTADKAATEALLVHLLNVIHTDASKPVAAVTVDQALALLAGIGPQDATEGLLAVQMVAAHVAAMDTARRAMQASQTPAGRLAYLALSGRLMRTFSGQLEALNRGRGKGVTQRVVVERVNVEAGAQAVVGAVAASGGGRGS